MALNDTLANALSKMMNLEKIGAKECTIKPTSKVIKKVMEVLHDNGYVGEIVETESSNGNHLTINMLGRINKCNAIKPRFSIGLETYDKFEKRFLPAKNFGVIIVTTNQGIMTHREAKEKRIGGKLLAYCY